MNLDKSNVVIFRNGGYIAQQEKWYFGKSEIAIVNIYKHLGVQMSTRLSFSHSLQEMSSKARKGVINVLKTLWKIGEKSPTIFFKLFKSPS